LDIDASIKVVSPIKNISNGVGINSLMLFIPGVSSYLEVSSISSLFFNMKSVTDEFSKDNSTKVFNEMLNKYLEDSKNNSTSVYLHQYDETLKSMLNYYEKYSMLGSGSKATLTLKESLSNKVKTLQILSIGKAAIHMILFVLALVGAFLFKGRYSEKAMHK
jgi:hypothetical protein